MRYVIFESTFIVKIFVLQRIVYGQNRFGLIVVVEEQMKACHLSQVKCHNCLSDWTIFIDMFVNFWYNGFTV